MYVLYILTLSNQSTDAFHITCVTIWTVRGCRPVALACFLSKDPRRLFICATLFCMHMCMV